jgi:DNA-directed RNA polymerase specialized sigma24 family protein
VSAETITAPSSDDVFSAVYAQHRAMVRWTILDRLVTRDNDLADDLTQETFLLLFKYRERIDFGPRIGGLLRVMARQSVGRHYRVMRNTRESAADMGHWSFANSNLCPAASGACEVVNTGFRTARIGGAK